MPNISINLLTRGRKHVLSKEDVKEINGLLLELSTNTKPVSEDFILSVADKGILFIARETTKKQRGKIVGIASLVLCHKLSGLSAWVEDVVLSPQYQGQGIGKLLMRALLEYDWSKDTNTKGAVPSRIELTSRPSRVAANKLYQSLGFEKYETNVYRKKVL